MALDGIDPGVCESACAYASMPVAACIQACVYAYVVAVMARPVEAESCKRAHAALGRCPQGS